MPAISFPARIGPTSTKNFTPKVKFHIGMVELPIGHEYSLRISVERKRMRKIKCVHIVGPDEQHSLSDLNEWIEKSGISEEDVISVQHVYYPCQFPSDGDQHQVQVYTYIFFWAD